MIEINEKIKHQLAQLPLSPGVYFYRNNSGEIIYIGKASRLRNRVRQYFQKSRYRDPKTDALVREIADIQWMEVDSELDALFLEAELIRRHLPKYNILLRDDKALAYVRIDIDSDYPTVSFTRRPLDDGARYFGPYTSVTAVRQALRLLRRVFPYAIKRSRHAKRSSLYYHIGLDPGLEDGHTTLEDYRANLRHLIAYISGQRVAIMRELERNMKRAAKAQDFERAARLRDQLESLRHLSQQIVFSDKEFIDISKDQALSELAELLGLPAYPHRIEGYDISHMSGTDVVASMVVFTNGVSHKTSYRKFKTTKDVNNDFLNMHETIKRRFKDKHLKDWGIPDLVLIDGGKGQLDAAISAYDKASKAIAIPFIGLAKREEQIVIDIARSNIKLNFNLMQKLHGHAVQSDNFILVTLPKSSNVVKLLQRVRDESHRFAVSYHSTLKTKRVTGSTLESIPGIGPATAKKLIKKFGSVKGVISADDSELTKVIGKSKTVSLRKVLG
ncbi:excinuclease ABC subunit UvrC [Patescibacteria group bacterium]|nr:excinuclease ABC subunit UvrC [Patescibacteria group bacterium]